MQQQYCFVARDSISIFNTPRWRPSFMLITWYWRISMLTLCPISQTHRSNLSLRYCFQLISRQSIIFILQIMQRMNTITTLISIIINPLHCCRIFKVSIITRRSWCIKIHIIQTMFAVIIHNNVRLSCPKT